MRSIHLHLIKEAHQFDLAFRSSQFRDKTHSIHIHILLRYLLNMLSRKWFIPQSFIFIFVWVLCLFYFIIWNFKILFLQLIFLILLSTEEKLRLLGLWRFYVRRYKIISTLLFEFFGVWDWGVLNIFYILDPIKMEVLWLLSFIQAMRCT